MKNEMRLARHGVWNSIDTLGFGPVLGTWMRIPAFLHLRYLTAYTLYWDDVLLISYDNLSMIKYS